MGIRQTTEEKQETEKEAPKETRDEIRAKYAANPTPKIIHLRKSAQKIIEGYTQALPS
jgi:hypothetical protein